MIVDTWLTREGSIDFLLPFEELFDGDRGLIRPPLVVTDFEVGMVNGVSFLKRCESE